MNTNTKENTNTEAVATLNGRGVYACGIKAITRTGNLATEKCGFGIALIIDNLSGSRQKYEMLAQLLKGCKDIATGAAYEEYTKEAMEEGRALAMLDKFSTATGIPMLEREATRVAELKKIAQESKQEPKGEKGGEKGAAKAKAKGKTGAERIAAVVNKLAEAERIAALLEVLDRLNREAAGAARLVLAGVSAEEAAAQIAKARAETKAARETAERAAKK
jgi:hypothetical protein